MNPDSISLLICAAAGLLIGSLIGFSACAILSIRRVQRTSVETWKAARRFYDRAYILTPKG